MAHIASIGAGIYTSLAYGTNDPTAATQAEYEAVAYTEVTNVRDFPAFLAPANIVNVPVYGQSQSSQIGAQADAPTLEFTLNYVPADHNALQALAGNGTTYLFRIRLANTELSNPVTAADEHSDFYVRGMIAAFQVTPSLSDSNQATVTLSTSGDYFGPFTTA